MTSRERILRMFEHREADRVPVTDSPWAATIERWQREGMPEKVYFLDFFDLDRIADIGVDNSPRFPEATLEETEEYRVYTTSWGATQKSWKHMASTPEFLDFTVKAPDTWRAAKARMVPTPDRINWEALKESYRQWREDGCWIRAAGWFGFDCTHSWFIGTERLLMALVENPEWCQEMFLHELEVDLALFDMIWEAGYEFDSLFWCDDMGYKQNQFFSLATYRNLIKPVHQRAIEWAHAKGIKAELHSCGDINPFVPELVNLGLDGLNPLEVKAGMNPVELKKQYGDKLTFHGGIDAVLWEDIEAMEAEIGRVLPVMKENGGYIFSTDHSVPSSVSLQDFRRITELAKKIGSY